MKFRFGFVSNSSTSSFCIYGITIDEDKVINIVKNNEEVTKKAYQRYHDRAVEWAAEGKEWAKEEADKSYEEWLKNALEEDSGFEAFEILFAGTEGYEWHVPEGYDEAYVGKSWHQVKDDQTGAQFKAEVEKTLTEMGIDGEFGTHAEDYQS